MTLKVSMAAKISFSTLFLLGGRVIKRCNMVAWTVLTVVSDVNWWHQCSTRATVLLILISCFGACVVARQQAEHGKMLQFQVLK